MNIDRAREIIGSSNKIDVTYDGRSVWINSINPTNGKAFVKTLDGTNEHHQVSVSELVEQ
ncbi:H-type small acid-soluble spore protein [Maledivibacter halophilus]|uniref:Small acid-soluble spore protein, H-type n=1 Tax=Maledivibacter halophilus TaxID=36842 RepID=A0A1T5MA19_9FIRM|nr:H-type small acid-soluble spore protein [Maledivibacter halophilus]SKC84953.1 small acid-soluble spore protein, H-type [Maledivibacter halophilus]